MKIFGSIAESQSKLTSELEQQGKLTIKLLI